MAGTKTTASPRVLPLMPLRGMILFPHTTMDFDVGRPPSIKAVEKAMERDQRIFIVTQKNTDVEDPKLKDLNPVGTIARIKQVLQITGGMLRVLVEGEQRAQLQRLAVAEEAWVAWVKPVPLLKEQDISPEMAAAVRVVHEHFQEYSEASQRISPEALRTVKAITSPEELADVIAGNAIGRMEEKEHLLSIKDPMERLEALAAALMKETRFAGLERMVQVRIRMQMDKNQKDYYLREQMRILQEELGEEEDEELEDYRKRLQKTSMNAEAKEKAEKEIERLSRMAPGTPETTVSENYLDWLLDLPWDKHTRDNLNLNRARRILDEDHYGMEQVKERIIDFLAVLGLRQRADKNAAMKGPVLCFVGPPGVGKTSIVKAVARSMGRQFVQMSLGGVRDESEIFGHRRTYIGAMPGHVISGIKRAGSMNPVFLFDEIDKMGNDYRGDPASAMLEVLDSEQNMHFRDHYLDVPVDLSRVMFVTTANTRESIPAPLLDRMEIIEVPSYTEEEKLQIAKRHLMKKQLTENGLDPKKVRITQDALRFVIEGYTREAGVRTLSRMLAKLARKTAVTMLDQDVDTVRIDRKTAREYLGAERYLRDKPGRDPLVGIVNGLAYTEVGGEMLQVECMVMPGSGKLTLTGSLGDVMKESAQAALSWLRAHSKEYHLADDFHTRQDIHIHVPEGAVPKDGPSAGVTMATALLSAVTGRRVRQDLAMTGEITLAGRVLPIGGVKEKMLAAFRAGISTLLLPRENAKDVSEIPAYIRERFQIEYVDSIARVAELALLEG
ncbi:MAG: endopeptidase La [Clostridiales bacterium]|nr:endopeptidase La [Clostridiales bacterium]